jgi:hypothetical protein
MENFPWNLESINGKTVYQHNKECQKAENLAAEKEAAAENEASPTTASPTKAVKDEEWYKKYKWGLLNRVNRKKNCNWVAENPCSGSRFDGWRCDTYGYTKYKVNKEKKIIGTGDVVKAKDICKEACNGC